jgi:hypothetical protein
VDIDHVVPAARTRADAEQALGLAGLGIARSRTISFLDGTARTLGLPE